MIKVIADEIEYISKEIETWKDPETGLIWEKQGAEKIMIWKEALEYAKSLGNDWRLPTIQELFSLIDYSKDRSTCKIPNSYSSSYWSSTVYMNNTGSVWLVDFHDGYVYNTYKSFSYCARCIKG